MKGRTVPSFLPGLPISGFLIFEKTFSICFLSNGVTSPNSCYANLIASGIFLIAPDLTRLVSDNKNFANGPISNKSFVFVATVHPDNLQDVL